MARLVSMQLTPWELGCLTALPPAAFPTVVPQDEATAMLVLQGLLLEAGL